MQRRWPSGRPLFKFSIGLLDKVSERPYNFTRPFGGYGLDLFVFGKGYLRARINIDVRWDEWVLPDGTMLFGGAAVINYSFGIKDWFRDVLDLPNKVSDSAYGYLESDDGWPYLMEGWWPGHDTGTLPLNGDSWVWIEDF
jgi:hypothetical protein